MGSLYLSFLVYYKFYVFIISSNIDKICRCYKICMLFIMNSHFFSCFGYCKYD